MYFLELGGWNLDPVSAGSTVFQAPVFIVIENDQNGRVEFVPD